MLQNTNQYADSHSTAYDYRTASRFIAFILVSLNDYNLACCSVCVSNLVAHTEGGAGVRVFMNRVLRRIFGPKRD